MPTAYSYLRFSTPEQSKGDSFRRQTQAARKYVEEHGLDLDESLTLHDLGVSAFRGKNAETGYLGEFLQAVETGLVEPGSFLLVESLDRISRDAAIDAIYLLKKICDGGVTVVTLIDRMEYTRDSLRNDNTPLLISLLTFMRANEESKTKSMRLKAVWDTKRKNNKPLTAKAPLWLHLDKELGEFRAIEERAQLVRRIFELYVNGAGPASIAETFNREGVPAWGRGGVWYKSYITKILGNPAVYGLGTPHKMEHDGGEKKRVPLETIVGYFPVVIEEETFALAQELKAGRGIMGCKVAAPTRNIFSRLSKCPVCGAAMIYVNKGGACQYLVCSAAKNGAGCAYRSVSYDRLEQSFLEAVRAGLVIPVDGEKLSRLERELAEAETRMNEFISQRNNLIDAIKQGTLRDDMITMTDVPVMVSEGKIEGRGKLFSEKKVPFTLRDEIEMLDQAVEANRKKIGQLRSQLNLLRPAAVEARVRELEQVTKGKEPDKGRVNAVLRMICKKVVIQYDASAIDMHFKHTDLLLSVPVKLREAARKQY